MKMEIRVDGLNETAGRVTIKEGDDGKIYATFDHAYSDFKLSEGDLYTLLILVRQIGGLGKEVAQ